VKGPCQIYLKSVQAVGERRNLTTCHPEVPVKRARVLKIGVPSTRGFGFARDGVIVSARVGPRDLLRPNLLRPKAEPRQSGNALPVIKVLIFPFVFSVSPCLRGEILPEVFA